jgi:hypothetical protein
VEAQPQFPRDRDLVVDARPGRPDVAVVGGRGATREQQLGATAVASRIASGVSRAQIG